MAKLFANSEDPDQMPHSAASDLGLHCLPIWGVSRLKSVKDLYLTDAWMDLVYTWTDVKHWFKVLFSSSSTCLSDLEVKVTESECFYTLNFTKHVLSEYVKGVKNLQNASLDLPDTWPDV